MLDESVGELVEHVRGQRPAHRQGTHVVDLAVDVDGEELPVLRGDAQRVEAVLEVEGDHPVVLLGDGAEALEGLHLHLSCVAVGVQGAEVDHEPPAASGLRDEERSRDPAR